MIMLVCVIGFAALVAMPVSAQEDFVRGDVNCDGAATWADTSALRARLFGGMPVHCEDAADVNDDGVVSIADFSTFINAMMGGPSIPPPYPDCGPDPTPDGIGCDSNCCAGSFVCPITRPGNINEDTVVNSSDIIKAVNFVFKSGPVPIPCEGAADVNCSGTITSADIIYLVFYVFKSGDPPCDVCPMMPDPWPCP